ncbi:hypothetical protein [Wolbachia endosymbiont (group A) of Beris morrisii]|uniref:hypothetical protein n=1 Tax=Wolbachia endosymbiont (group A) of Beris morrisii TaxID=3066139 RepID=UPI003341402E
MIDRKNNFTISKNVKQGIIKDVEGIRRKNGRYSYKVPVLSPEEQYEELFESKQAIRFDLNHFMSSNISKSMNLKNRFEETLGFDPEEGLCHPLNYFITAIGLKNKEDFAKLLKHDYVVSEQDFIAYVDTGQGQTTKLLAIQVLAQCLPVLDVQSIDRREGESFYDEMIYDQLCKDLSLMRRQVNIDQEQVKRALKDVGTERYLEFIFACGTYCKKNGTDNSYYTSNSDSDYPIDNNDYNVSSAHSMLVYKAENSKYIFFDPNEGAVGFCPDTGVANLTSEEICKTLELAVNLYSYDQYIEDFLIVPDSFYTYVMLADATLMLKKAEQFYETAKDPSSKIVDISVNKNTGNLSFIPVIP